MARTLAINGKGKLSLAFAAGAIFGLMETDRMDQISVLRGIGSGNILLGFFHAALNKHNPVSLMNDVVAPLFQFCNEATEARCIWNRLKAPSRWFDPWEQELFHYFAKLWPCTALPVPSWRFEYLSNLPQHYNSILCINSDTPQAGAVFLHPDQQNAVILNLPPASIAHSVCSGVLSSFKLDSKIHTKPCTFTDPFGYPKPALIVDSLPRRYTVRYADTREGVPTISACNNPDYRRAFHEDELSVVDLMNLFEEDHTTWESTPYSSLFHAANWGYALVFLRLFPHRMLPDGLLFQQVEDLYNITGLFLP